jgi:integrase
MREVDGIRLAINQEPVSSSAITIRQLFEHYESTELTAGAGKTVTTVKVYRHHLLGVIVPQWGSYSLGEVRAIDVERWLKTLSGAPATKAKTRNVMSALYQHAIRHGWATHNPISAVRQSSKRLKEPDVLTHEEGMALLSELAEPCRTAVLVAMTTGLRRGELFGLKWEDVRIDYHMPERSQLRIVRSVVNGIEGDVKTAGSKRLLPIDEDAAAALAAWRRKSRFSSDADWVFTSPTSLGRKPYAPKTQLDRHVIPAAQRAKITKTIGWHTFRRTYATLLQARGANMKVTQELMRHASPVMTMGTYAQAITEDKRAAQASVASLFKGASGGPVWTHQEGCGPGNYL